MAIIDFNSVSGVSTVTATSSIRVGSGVTITSTSIVGVSTVGVTTIFVGTGASISSPATNVLTLGTNNTESVRIDSSGRIQQNDSYNDEWGAGFISHKPQSVTNMYFRPSGQYTTSLGKVDNTNTTQFVSIDSAYNQTSSVSAGLFLSAFHADAGGSSCGFTLKNLRTDAGGLVFSSVTTGSNGSNAIETERLRIDSSGRVTMPYQPVSCVYGNAGGSVNTGNEATWVIVKFANSTVNRGSAYSSSTGLYTCPVAGVYFVSAFFLTRANAAHNITIYKNGAGIGPTGRDITPSGEQNTGVMAYVNCAANDTLGIYFSNGSGGDFYVDYNYALFSLLG